MLAFFFLLFTQHAFGCFDNPHVVLLQIAAAGRFVGQCAGRLHGDPHVGDHLGHGRQTLDRTAELVPAVGVSARQTERRLGNAQRLRRDADPGPVHQRPNVRDQSALPFADQPGRRIVVNQLARR